MRRRGGQDREKRGTGMRRGGQEWEEGDRKEIKKTEKETKTKGEKEGRNNVMDKFINDVWDLRESKVVSRANFKHFFKPKKWKTRICREYLVWKWIRY